METTSVGNIYKVIVAPVLGVNRLLHMRIDGDHAMVEIWMLTYQSEAKLVLISHMFHTKIKLTLPDPTP